jgi:uncharacterized lipoprotein YbaY
MKTQKTDRPLVTGQVIIKATAPGFDNATVHVYLEDVSLADAEAGAVAEAVVPAVRHAPATGDTTVPFALAAAGAAAIDPRRHYAVRVWVDRDNSGEKSRDDLYSDQVHPVLTHGYGDTVTITLGPVASGA